MKPIFDRRDELAGKPGLHALIVGISDYTHLPNDDEEAPKDDFACRKLTSGAITAYKIYQWLIRRQDRLAVPLASCRLLLAPSEREAKDEKALDELKVPCNVNDFLTAANAWCQDAQGNRDNTTLFYFSGLGKELSRSEPIIMLQDFGSPVGPVLRGTVSVNNLLYGMSPTERQKDIARTQLFFLDSSRVILPELQSYQVANTTRVFDAALLGVDDRRAPVFYAAPPGGRAFAVKGQQTLFSTVLLDCLNGDAAVPEEIDEEGNEPHWCVTISSLIDGLGQGLKALNEKNRRYKIEQHFTVGGLVRDAVLHYLDAAPQVEVRVEVAPAGAAKRTRVELIDDQGKKFATTKDSSNPQIFTATVPGGFYGLTAVTEGEAVEQKTRMRLVKPPHTQWKVKVAGEPDR